MRRAACRVAGASLGALALAACNLDPGAGYIEIKTVPVSAISQPALYLDSVRLQPLKKGTAVLKQQVGTRKLQIDGRGGQLAELCAIVVKKNRITTVTVSILERPPRCQCRTGDHAAAARTCIG